MGRADVAPEVLDLGGGELKKEDVLVHFNTNGLLLDEERVQRIIDLKIDSVKFSFQGIDELTYQEMRNNGSYTQLTDTIKLMYHMRGESRTPYISVTTSTTYESDEDIDRFKKEIGQYCDEIDVGRTKMQHVDIDHMELAEERRAIYINYLKNEQGTMQRMTVCPEIWDKLSINWDGSVSACCQDYDNLMIVGNILEEDLPEIFMSAKEQAYREILRYDDYDKLILCRNCYEYIPLRKEKMGKDE